MTLNALILICGIPNAGKTTYSSRYDNVIHLDDVCNYKHCAEIASQTNGEVVVEGVFYNIRQRKKLLEICNDKSPKICIWMDTPIEECKRRENAYRRRPSWIVGDYHNAFEPPTLDEGWDNIIRIIDNGECGALNN